MDWSNITYKQLEALKNANDIQDENDRTIAIMQAVYGDNVIELPLKEFNKKALDLKFLKEEIPNNVKVKNVVVNKRKYYFDGMLGNITTAQYIDFQNYLKNKDEMKSFSVFFIPEGHKYNDGYDMMQVFEDIQEMPAPILVSASFFFTRQLETFITIFQRSSLKKLKKLNLPKNMKENLIKMVESSNNLVSSLMSSNFAKSQTIPQMKQ